MSYVVRVLVRRRLARNLVLGLLVAITGGTLLAAAAGARRTETAFDRLLAVTHPADVTVGLAPDAPEDLLRAVEHERHVETAAWGVALAVAPADHPELYLPIAGSGDGRWGTVVDAPRIIAGRRVHQAASDEVTLTERRAAALGVTVGDTFVLGSFSASQIDRLRSGGDVYSEAPAGPRVRMRVVGIERGPASLVTDNDVGEVTILPRGYVARYGQDVGTYGRFVLVRLTGGPDDVPAFAAAIHRIHGLENADIQGTTGDPGGVGDASRFVATGLLLFAIVVAAAGAVAISQALGRSAAGDAVDFEALGALGMTRRQRAAMSALAVAPALGLGTAGAALLSIAASSWFPFGLAGRAEPHRGVRVDWAVIGVGCITLGVALAVLALIVAARAQRLAASGSADAPMPQVTRWLTGIRLQPAWSTGIRFALDSGRGPRALPARTALTAAVAGSAGLVAVLTFGASLDRVVHTPSAFGRAWDITVSGPGDDRALLSDPAIAEAADVRIGAIEANGQPARARGLRSLSGPLPVTITRGRAPKRVREVALGADTMRRVGARLGGTVELRGSDGRGRFTVVGEALFAGLDDTPQLADAVALTGDAFDGLIDPETGDAFTTRVIRLAPGADRAAALRRLRKLYHGGDSPPGVDTRVPIEVMKLREADQLPVLLGAFLTLLAFVALAHALIVATRRRRVELAVLRTLGFRPRDVRRAVTAQATTVALIGTIIGIPLGIAAGRLAWRPVAHGLGVAVVPVVPVVAVTVVVAAALLIANVMAVPAGLAAARIRPAAVLRSE